MSGPTVFRVTHRSAVVERIAPLLCRRLGCRWQTRRGYDWCPRCGASAWHGAMRHAASA